MKNYNGEVIVNEDFDKSQLPKIMDDLKEDFSSGNFKKTFLALESAIKSLGPFLN